MDDWAQVECRSSANDEFIECRHSTCVLDESVFSPPVVEYAGLALVRLPPAGFAPSVAISVIRDGLISSVSWIWMKLCGTRRARTARAARRTHSNCDFVYLPQSFMGIVWHQQLLAAVDAAAVGVVVGAVAVAGEIRETRNTIKVSTGLLFLFLEITSR